MRAIHINWTKPYKERTDKGYRAEDFEIFTTVLSALVWREKNGEIAMITDSDGYKFYNDCGLIPVWNEVSTSLDKMPKVSTKMFWAAGKIYALMNEKAPVAVLDTDFIVWEKLDFDKLGDVSVIHFEDLNKDIYPDKDYFLLKDGYEFDKKLDWEIKPSNTAFYVIKNQEFLKSYSESALCFMDNVKDVDDNLRYMVFAEQRLFSMCAKELSISLGTISDIETLFKNGEKTFTHIWGMKQQMRDNEMLRYDFCMRCKERIKKDYPRVSKILSNIDILKMYY